MYFELPLKAFVQALHKLHRESSTGMVFFMSEGSRWGKAIFKNGEIVSLIYQNLEGPSALAEMRTLELVQYYFRPETAHQLVERRHADFSTSGFFTYFGLEMDQPARRQPERPVLGQQINDQLAQPQGNQKILIADDSGIARKALSISLNRMGYQVIEAKDGFEALGQLQNERPNMLFLDLIMPGIDGYKVMDMIKKSKHLRDIPIIILTGRDGMMDKVKGKLSGCKEYLTKPVAEETLLRIVHKYLDN